LKKLPWAVDAAWGVSERDRGCVTWDIEGMSRERERKGLGRGVVVSELSEGCVRVLSVVGYGQPL